MHTAATNDQTQCPSMEPQTTQTHCFSMGLNQELNTTFQFVTFGQEETRLPDRKKRRTHDPNEPTSTNPSTLRSRRHRQKNKGQKEEHPENLKALVKHSTNPQFSSTSSSNNFISFDPSIHDAHLANLELSWNNPIPFIPENVPFSSGTSVHPECASTNPLYTDPSMPISAPPTRIPIEIAIDTHDLVSFADKAVGTTPACQEPCASDQIDLTSFNGFEYPTESRTVAWPGSRFITKLPFVADPIHPTINLLQAEANHVETLATTANLSSKWVTSLHYDDYRNERDLAFALRNEISWGRSILLRGHAYSPASVELDDLNLRFNYVEDHEVFACDAVKRISNHTHPHIVMKLKDFCDGTQDNSRIQCVLDSPTLDGEVPPFMKFLDDGHTAYNRVHGYCKWRQHKALDVQKSTSWALLHQGLYHTYVHHDSDGYSTWVQILSGYKFWVIVRHKNFDSDANRTRLYESVNEYMDMEPKDYGFYGPESDRTVIYAGPGDIIIMPPGAYHEVYTPVPSVTIGGHFYSYNSLHLTEMSRSLDRRTDGKFTNTAHPSTTLTIALMLVVLPLLKDRALHRKPLAALCRMVLHPMAYSPSFEDVNFTQWKSSNRRSKKTKLEDFEIAYKAAKNLLSKLELPRNVQHYPSKTPEAPDFIFDGAGFHDPGDKVEWQDHVTSLPPLQ